MELRNPGMKDRHGRILLASSIQLVLLYLPMFAVLFQLGRMGYEHVKSRHKDQLTRIVEVDDILDHDTDQKSALLSSDHGTS